MKSPRTPSIWMRGAPNAEMPDRGGQDGNTPVCYRCGQPGYIMVGCRNEPAEGSRKQMAAGNGRQPLPWGNQRL